MFDEETLILVVIVYGLVFGGTCSWLAGEKGREGERTNEKSQTLLNRRRHFGAMSRGIVII